MLRLMNVAGPVSSYVARWASKLAPAKSLKALDLPCGGGRHALQLAELGFEVIAADIDPKRLADLTTALAASPGAHVSMMLADATKPLLFPPDAFGLIVTTHFVSAEWLRQVPELLRSGGLFIYESYGGQGENWRALPKSGEVAAQLAAQLDLLDYRERPSGPPIVGAVTVKAVGRRR